MGLQRFAKFQELLRHGHYPRKMGFKTSAGEINVFANRMRLARSFGGIDLEGYSETTVLGYQGFLRVFLTHSALECFMRINFASTNIDNLGPSIEGFHPEAVHKEFIEKDKKGLLFNFLYEKVENRLKPKLSDFRDGKNTNVGYLSASIRHIFAHGHLTAHTAGINPRNIDTICTSVSVFLIDYMDNEFTKKIDGYCTKVAS